MSALAGKVAIVTGSGRGIGRQIALKLASARASVVVNDLDDEPASETVSLIEAAGGRAMTCNGDVAAVDFGDRIVNAALEGLGGLEIIVNNAAISGTPQYSATRMNNGRPCWMYMPRHRFAYCGRRRTIFAPRRSGRLQKAILSSARWSISRPFQVRTVPPLKWLIPLARQLLWA